MMTSMPLKDVTQLRLSSANKAASVKPHEVSKPATFSVAIQPQPVQTLQQQQPQPQPQQPARRYRHDPYGWNWRMPFEQAMQQPQQVLPIMPLVPAVHAASPQSALEVASPQSPQTAVDANEPFVPQGDTVCCSLIQFKCHHGEYSSSFELRKGQYVVVQGDRGMDVGVVIRINTDENQQYVQRTGPTGPVLRYATQREVDYWATDLKGDEAAALDYCKQRVVKHRLNMDVRHAEYQFDKKKLTFYYEAKSRVDFVTLLKELFREFSCRIWMEKIRTHE